MIRLVPLGELLHRSTDTVVLRPDGVYREITIRLWGKGVIERRTATGAEIAGTRRSVVKPDQFILSRIDARNGACGIVPNSLGGSVVSNDFPTFDVVPSVALPTYVGWIGRANQFVDICRRASEGTTNRVRLQEARFLRETIPLPLIEEQLRIVARIEQLSAAIASIRRVVDDVLDESKNVLTAMTSQMYEGLRGCPEFVLGELGPRGSNPIQTGSFGAQLHKSEFVNEGVPVLNVGNVTVHGLDTRRLDFVVRSKAAELARYQFQPNDLLFARTGATLGKVCLVPDGCVGWLMTDHLFRVRLDQDRCDPKFLLAVFRGSGQERDQVFDMVRGATRPGFNTTLLSNVRVRLPPLPRQAEFVAALETVSERLVDLRTLSTARAAGLEALLPSILDKAFKGEL